MKERRTWPNIIFIASPNRVTLSRGLDAQRHRRGLGAGVRRFLQSGVQRTPEYRENINEMGEAPVLATAVRSSASPA